jgi:hypothetical protein
LGATPASAATDPVPPPDVPAPESPHEAPATTTVPQPTTTQPPKSVPVRPSPAGERPADSQPDDGFGIDFPSSPVALFGVAGTMLAAGAFGAWHRRRRRRQVTLTADQAVAAPPGITSPVQLEMCQTDLEPVVWLDRVLRHLADSVNPASDGRWPRPLVIQVGPGWADVMLADPWPDAPVPWRAELSGAVWQWDPPAGWAPPEPEPDRWAPLPALASVGAQDDGTQLLVDLETAATVGLVGDAEHIAGLARSLVLQLACSPLRETAASVTLVGFDAPGIDALAQVRRPLDITEAARPLLSAARATRVTLDQSGAASTFAARAEGRLELAAPEIAVLGEPAEDESLEDLLTLLADRRGGVVLVCVGWCPAMAVRIEVADGQVQIPALGLGARAQAITVDTADHIGVIVDSPDAEPEQLPLLDVPDPAQPGLDSPDGYEDRHWEVLVRLLGGRPTVVAEGHRLSPKQVAALAYLALHRSVTIDKLRDAVWGGKDVTPKRVLGVLSELRTALGEDLIPTVNDGMASVGRAVATDVDLFDRRVAFPDDKPPRRRSPP